MTKIISVIKVEHIRKCFGDTIAVDDLSFEINKGEIVGFLGPNGAGKTTTMRIMTGFISADYGSVHIGGIPIETMADQAQAHIGYMPENNPLYKDMLVSELLDLSANLQKMAKHKQRSILDFVVSAVSIGDVYYHPLGELSKGYKQRVGIACAMIHNPNVLVMDEPTEGLDPNQRSEIRALIKGLSKERTIIMSTHVMQEAQAVCNRLIVINKGKLVADGTAEQITASFNPENVILLEVEGHEIETSLQKLQGINHVDYKKLGVNKIKARITTDKDAEIRPDISRLANKNNWVIWQLHEEEHKLEDVFHALTANHTK
jgi:ABC-2 type transport system ATP-binding protein